MMISIVICSRSPQQLSLVKENIQKTIGVPYEIIVIENSSGKHSTGEAYNNGARLAKYQYLCFLHEDIEFINTGWGANMIRHFGDEELGLIGLAGSSYKSRLLSGWGGVQQFDYCNIYQKEKDSGFTHLYSNPRNEEISRVVVIDGVFLATKRSVWEDREFDQDILKGFHCYDLDFSLRVIDKYKVAVVYDIIIRHFSSGNFDEEWLKWSFILHKKFRWKLPVVAPDCQKINKIIVDFRIFKYWGRRIFGSKDIGFFYKMNWLLNSFFVFFSDRWLYSKANRLK